MAGTDATRMLASSLEAERTRRRRSTWRSRRASPRGSSPSSAIRLRRAAGDDEEAAALRQEAARRKEYYDKMEEIGQVEEDRERIRSLFESDPVESGFE